MGSRLADINSVKQFIKDPENENITKKTQHNIALLKEFLTLRNESRLVEEIHKPKRKPKFLCMGLLSFFLEMNYFKSSVSPF